MHNSFTDILKAGGILMFGVFIGWLSELRCNDSPIKNSDSVRYHLYRAKTIEQSDSLVFPLYLTEQEEKVLHVGDYTWMDPQNNRPVNPGSDMASFLNVVVEKKVDNDVYTK